MFIPLSAAVLDPTQRKWDHSYVARILAAGPGRIKRDKKGFATAERIPMTVKVGDLVAMRQQNFPYDKAEYFGGAGTIYFARESDVGGRLKS